MTARGVPRKDLVLGGIFSFVVGGVADRLFPVLQTPVEDIVYEVLDARELPSRQKVRELRNKVDTLEKTIGDLVTALEGMKAEVAAVAAARAAAPAAPAAAPAKKAAAKAKPKSKPAVAGARVCKVPDCGGVIRAKGFCGKHYQKFKRNTLPGFVGTDGITVTDDGVRYAVAGASAGEAVGVALAGDEVVFTLADAELRASVADARLD